MIKLPESRCRGKESHAEWKTTLCVLDSLAPSGRRRTYPVRLAKLSARSDSLVATHLRHLDTLSTCLSRAANFFCFTVVPEANINDNRNHQMICRNTWSSLQYTLRGLLRFQPSETRLLASHPETQQELKRNFISVRVEYKLPLTFKEVVVSGLGSFAS